MCCYILNDILFQLFWWVGAPPPPSLCMKHCLLMLCVSCVVVSELSNLLLMRADYPASLLRSVVAVVLCVVGYVCLYM